MEPYTCQTCGAPTESPTDRCDSCSGAGNETEEALNETPTQIGIPNASAKSNSPTLVFGPVTITSSEAKAGIFTGVGAFVSTGVIYTILAMIFASAAGQIHVPPYAGLAALLALTYHVGISIQFGASVAISGALLNLTVLALFIVVVATRIRERRFPAQSALEAVVRSALTAIAYGVLATIVGLTASGLNVNPIEMLIFSIFAVMVTTLSATGHLLPLIQQQFDTVVNWITGAIRYIQDAVLATAMLLIAGLAVEVALLLGSGVTQSVSSKFGILLLGGTNFAILLGEMLLGGQGGISISGGTGGATSGLLAHHVGFYSPPLGGAYLLLFILPVLIVGVTAGRVRRRGEVPPIGDIWKTALAWGGMWLVLGLVSTITVSVSESFLGTIAGAAVVGPEVLVGVVLAALWGALSHLVAIYVPISIHKGGWQFDSSPTSDTNHEDSEAAPSGVVSNESVENTGTDSGTPEVPTDTEASVVADTAVIPTTTTTAAPAVTPTKKSFEMPKIAPLTVKRLKIAATTAFGVAIVAVGGFLYLQNSDTPSSTVVSYVSALESGHAASALSLALGHPSGVLLSNAALKTEQANPAGHFSGKPQVLSSSTNGKSATVVVSMPYVAGGKADPYRWTVDLVQDSKAKRFGLFPTWKLLNGTGTIAITTKANVAQWILDNQPVHGGAPYLAVFPGLVKSSVTGASTAFVTAMPLHSQMLIKGPGALATAQVRYQFSANALALGLQAADKVIDSTCISGNTQASNQNCPNQDYLAELFANGSVSWSLNGSISIDKSSVSQNPISGDETFVVAFNTTCSYQDTSGNSYSDPYSVSGMEVSVSPTGQATIISQGQAN